MKRAPVESRSIRSVGFSEPRHVLQIEFYGSHSVYEYYGVPAEVILKFLEAKSKGRFFKAFIRGKYDYQKVH